MDVREIQYLDTWSRDNALVGGNPSKEIGFVFKCLECTCVCVLCVCVCVCACVCVQYSDRFQKVYKKKKGE